MKQQSSDGGPTLRRKTQLHTNPPPHPPAQETSAPSARWGTCCLGGWRRPGARSAALSWAAGGARTSGRRSAPRRPSPLLPSSAAHVSAPAREQRRGPAWASAPDRSPAGRRGPSGSQGRGAPPAAGLSGALAGRPARRPPISPDSNTRPPTPWGGAGRARRGVGVQAAGDRGSGVWDPCV